MATWAPMGLLLSQVNRIYSSHLISLWFILISASQLCLGSSSGLFPSRFSFEILYTFPTCTMHAVCLSHPILDLPNNIWHAANYEAYHYKSTVFSALL